MPDNPRKVILLVEDEAIIAMDESNKLSREGYEIILASSGEMAVAMVCGENPHPIDLILMDINLGRGMDGTQAAQEILHTRDIPIVFLSSHAERDIVERTEKITSYGYVVKNSPLTVLLTSIKMAFRLHAAHVELNRSNLLLEKEIKERFHVQETLRRSEASLKRAEQIAHFGYWDWQIQTDRLNWSEEVYRLYGLVPGEDTPTFAVVVQSMPPDEQQRFLESVRQTLEEDAPFSAEYRMHDKQGRNHYIRTTGEILRDANGEPVSMFGVVQDITESRQAEEALQSAQEKLAMAFSNLYDLYFEIDQDGRIVDFYTPHPELLYARPEDFLGKVADDFLPEAASRIFENAIAITMERGFYNSARYSLDFPDGERWFELIMAIKGDPKDKRFVSMVRDITSIKETEDALHLSENTLQAWMDAIQESAMLIDTEGNVIMANATVAERLKVTPQQLIGSNVFGRVDPVTAANRKAQLAKVIATGQSVRFEDERAGRIIDNQISPVFDASGRVQQVAILGIDITQRIIDENTLLQKHTQLEAMIRAIPDLMFRLNREGVYLDYKAEDSELYTRGGPVIGQRNRDLTPPAFADLIDEKINAALDSGKMVTFEYDLARPGEEAGIFEARMMPSGPDEVTAIVRNVTEQKRREAQINALLREKEVLLREVHHRIKNNMSTIFSLLQLQISFQHDPGVVEALQDASGRVQSMLVLYERLYRSQDFATISMRDYLADLLDQVVELFPNRGNVRLELNLEDIPLTPRQVYPLGIIINELTTNAMKYAFAGRQSGMIRLKALRLQNSAQVILEDDGVGIPDTFELETSPGFGMHLVKMLTAQIDGLVELERGSGTRFVITFPLENQVAAAQQNAAAQQDADA